MNNDRKLYQRILDTDWNMSQGVVADLVTWDEYDEVNKLGSQIEELLELKYTEDTVRDWRSYRFCH